MIKINRKCKRIINRVLALFFFLLLIACKENKIEISIQPYSNFDDNLLNIVVKVIEEFYDAEVTVLENKDIPQKTFVNIKGPRYRADLLLKELKSVKPKSSDYILGLTHYDISTTMRDKNGKVKRPASTYNDWGVLGLGYRPGPSCVVSTKRMENPSRYVLIDRLKKVCIHELGHNLGLKHCETQGCVMMDSKGKVSTVDLKFLKLCEDCEKEISRR
jgi:archaemetzincin